MKDNSKQKTGLDILQNFFGIESTPPKNKVPTEELSSMSPIKDTQEFFESIGLDGVPTKEDVVETAKGLSSDNKSKDKLIRSLHNQVKKLEAKIEEQKQLHAIEIRGKDRIIELQQNQIDDVREILSRLKHNDFPED